jgi:uncharacterized membrane protein
MLLSDINAIISWWFILFLLGVGFLPLTSVLFHKFFDKGYIFSKMLGLGLTGYAVFLLGILHIAPFRMLTSYVIFFLTAMFFFFILREKKTILTTLKNKLLIFALEEALFAALLFTWAYIHSFAPDIHGLEKYMDFGFINSFLRSDYFPPKDMWFTPLYINYYYFGHFFTALIIKLSDVPANISFNLMLSTIFALCFSQTFSLGANIYAFLKRTRKIKKIELIFSGLLTACLTTLAGNLHIIYAFFSPYKADNPVPFWQLEYLPTAFPNSYWYPNATRFIYHTIHEFPIYSWVVADLHGHVLDIPFVILIIALLLSFFISSSEQNEQLGVQKTHKLKNVGLLTYWKTRFSQIPLILDLPKLLLLGFLLAIMYMTNAWDGAIYLLLAGLVLLALHWQKLTHYKSKITWTTHLIVSCVVLALSLGIFTLPYSIFFKPFVSGIGVLCSPEALIKIGKLGPLLFEADHCQNSYWWELLSLYGFFYFFVLSFVFFSFKLKKHSATDIFVFLLTILSTILIILPEFIYVKDIYPAHYRANTMFKLVFQAFIMLSISSSYIIMRLVSSMNFRELSRLKRVHAAFYTLITIYLVSLVMTYPYLAIKSYYNDLKIYKGLDGTRYLKLQYPTDYAAITWINKTIKGQPVILEAQGDSYTDYARVSANTGLPTVLGWTVHEWLWRGTYDIPAPRINEVKTLYETKDPIIARPLLQKYNVRYVFIGALEYEKYPKLDAEKFSQVGNLVFKDGTTKIYRINR